ncbi:hypothetical protein [Acanthopleuribacter pedis]|uniref:Uncharacterized protein n=1 Tax=Acanthopleuribacter pedis TaxID=442870 RepID=A0A8J7QNI9_9BACT|nr:hypothetical protein [Acanthopleuribacter pedis]MBO1321698.1 hypothetical protein [Acanthopleuribacter pedis]
MLVSLLLCLSLGEMTVPTAPEAFPHFEGKNLNGEQVQFAEWDRPVTLIFVAFKQEQQPQVDQWVTALEPLKEQHPSLDYVELPTVKKVSRFVKYMIYRGMRSGIKDPHQRQRIVTQYVDVPDYMNRLNLSDPEVIATYAVCNEGRILKHWLGPVDDTFIEELKTVLDETAAGESGQTTADAG